MALSSSWNTVVGARERVAGRKRDVHNHCPLCQHSPHSAVTAKLSHRGGNRNKAVCKNSSGEFNGHCCPHNRLRTQTFGEDKSKGKGLCSNRQAKDTGNRPSRRRCVKVTGWADGVLLWWTWFSFGINIKLNPDLYKQPPSVWAIGRAPSKTPGI